MTVSWRTASAGIVGLVMALNFLPAIADEPPLELGGDLRVELVSATPGPIGGKSDLRFRIVNDSQAKVVLLGIETPVAERANLVAGLGSGRTGVLQSFTIAPEDRFDLTTSHLRYEIFPLNRPLVSGEEFPVTLNFLSFSITVSAHVH